MQQPSSSSSSDKDPDEPLPSPKGKALAEQQQDIDDRYALLLQMLFIMKSFIDYLVFDKFEIEIWKSII